MHRLWDCVETALHPWSHITCSCISSFQFQSNFSRTFDLMWARSSLGQPKGVRPECGYQGCRAWKDIYYLWTWEHVELSYTRTKGYKRLIRVDHSMLKQSNKSDHISLCWKKRWLFFFHIQDQRCAVAVWYSHVQEWSKLADVEAENSTALGVLLQVPVRQWSKKSPLSNNYTSLKAWQMPKHSRAAHVTQSLREF